MFCRGDPRRTKGRRVFLLLRGTVNTFLLLMLVD